MLFLILTVKKRFFMLKFYELMTETSYANILNEFVVASYGMIIEIV